MAKLVALTIMVIAIASAIPIVMHNEHLCLTFGRGRRTGQESIEDMIEIALQIEQIVKKVFPSHKICHHCSPF